MKTVGETECASMNAPCFYVEIIECIRFCLIIPWYYFSIPSFSNTSLPRFTLLIILPDANDGLPDLLDSMYKHGGVSSILSTSFQNTKMRLYLPKFRLREGYAIKLKDHLRKLGINDAFCPLSADFSNVSDSDRMCISDVMHKAVFEVSQLDTCRKHIFGNCFDLS